MGKLNKVAGYRAMLELTQEEFGGKLRMSKQLYSRKERGQISFNDYEKTEIKKLLTPYFPNITIDEIFFDGK